MVAEITIAELSFHRGWDTHMEFSAKLMNPLGGVLGEYLSEASVRIIATGRAARVGARCYEWRTKPWMGRAVPYGSYGKRTWQWRITSS